MSYDAAITVFGVGCVLVFLLVIMSDGKPPRGTFAAFMVACALATIATIVQLARP